MDVASAFASSMDQIAVMIEGLTEEMRKQWKKARGGGGAGAGGEQRSFLDPLLGFVHAVDWTEPWLVGLIVFHITLLVLAVASRKHSNVQMAMFFCVLLCVYVAERMNIYLHRHWKSFARQPYFDSHGVFLSVVWSGPLLLVSALILFNSLLTLTSLMVKWKRAELKHRALASAKKNKEQ